MAQYNVTFSELDALLKSLPENTVDTPYDISITEITKEQCEGSVTAKSGTLQYVLQNNPSKYVSLSFSKLPDDLTKTISMFDSCTSLTSIDTSGFINVYDASYMFYNCTSLKNINTTGLGNVTYANYMFQNCNSLEKIDLSGFSSVESSIGMFRNCSSLITVENTSGFINSTLTGNMFFDCISLKHIDTSGFENAEVCTFMFFNCKSLEIIRTSAFKNATYVNGMFLNCESLKEICFWGFDISKIDSDNVEHYGGMLEGCTSLTKIYCDDFGISIPHEASDDEWKVYDGSTFTDSGKYEEVKDFIVNKLPELSETELQEIEVYKTCNIYTPFVHLNTLLSQLTENDINTDYPIIITEITANQCKGDNSANTLGYVLRHNSNKYISLYISTVPFLISTSSMLEDCTNVVYFALGDEETQMQITEAYAMFKGCTSLKSTDCSGFLNITDAEDMFRGCTSLTSIDCSAFNQVVNASFMFYECTSLTSIDCSSFTNVTTADYMFGYSTLLHTINLWGFDVKKIMYYNNMFTGTDLSDVYLKSFIFPNPYDGSSFPNVSQEVTDVSNFINNTLGISGATVHKGELIYDTPINTPFVHLNILLSQLPENTTETPYEIEITEINAEQCKGSRTAIEGTLQYVLQHNNEKYVSLSFSTILTHFTSASYTFYGCTSLITIDTSAFNNVINAIGMFMECAGLTNIETDAFTNVTDTSAMFKDCKSLTEISAASFLNSTDTRSMFSGCSNLSVISEPNFTQSVNASYMFDDCGKLEEIDTSTFENIKDASYMFRSSGIRTIDASYFSNVTNATYMFHDCSYLRRVDRPNFSNVTNVIHMFSACENLTSIDTTTFGKVTDTTNMFNRCTSLKTIEKWGFYTSNITKYGGMFTTSINDIYIKDYYMPEEYDGFSFNIQSIKDFLDKVKVSCARYHEGLVVLPEKIKTPFSYFRRLLYNLNTNTKEEPYNICITEITKKECTGHEIPVSGTVQYHLNSFPSKYVGLSFLSLPDDYTDATYMFYKIDSLISFDSSNCTNIRNAVFMFEQCSNLETFDSSGLINLMDATQMFRQCYALESVNTTGFTKVLNAQAMFSECRNLERIDTNAFANVINASAMFHDTGLKEIDLSNMTNVENADRMFENCSNLKSIWNWSFNKDKFTSFTDIITGTHEDLQIYISYDEPMEKDTYSLIRLRTKEDGNKTIYYKEIPTKSGQEGNEGTLEVESDLDAVIQLNNKTDELAIGDINNEQFNTMFVHKYKWTDEANCLDPSQKNFIFWAAPGSKIVSNVAGGGGGGKEEIKELSKEDYEGLPESEKLNGVAYFIPDAESPDVLTIDDNVTTDRTTWSSEKIADEISKGGGGGGSALVPSITQEQYNDLTEEEKNNGQIREITNAEGTPIPFATLNDELTTSSNVLSAQETENRLNGALADYNELGDWQDIPRNEIPKSSADPFIMPYDGYFTMNSGNDELVLHYSSNGIDWFLNQIIGTGRFAVCNTFFFKKGTKIYREGGDTYSIFTVAYYTKRDYSNRL